MSILRTFVLISVLSVSFLSSCATDEIILSTPDIDSVQVELLGSYQVQETRLPARLLYPWSIQ